MNKKVLITGSNGLLGQKIIDLFKTKKEFDIITTSKGENRYPNNPFIYVDLDITNRQEVIKQLDYYKPDFIINTAAKTNVDACEEEKKSCDNLNVNSVKYLIESCEKHNTHLIHISTDFIFDGEAPKYTEKSVPNPLSYYGLSKLKAEQVILKSNVRYSILRTIIIYGIAHNMSRSNIVLWAKKMLEEKQKIKIVKDQVRTPTFAEDLALACLLVIEKGKTGIFNTSGKDAMSIYDMVLRIADFWRLDESLIGTSTTEELNQKAKRPPTTIFDLTKSNKELGYFPIKFEEALAIIDNQLKEYL